MNRSLIISLGIKNPPQIRLEEGRKAHALPLNSFGCWLGSGSMFCRCSVTIFLGRASSPTTPEVLCRPSSSSSNLLFPVKGWLVVVPACDTPGSLFPFVPLFHCRNQSKMQRALTSRARASALSGAYKYRSGGSLGQQLRFAHKVGYGNWDDKLQMVSWD